MKSASPPENLTKSDYESLAAFRRSLRRFLRYAEDGARRAGLTPQQHQVLLAIKGQPGRDWASIAELAEALQLRHHTVVGLVDRSAAAGLVRRDPDPEDRRQVRVVLTERGEGVLNSLSTSNVEELRRLQRSLNLDLLHE